MCVWGGKEALYTPKIWSQSSRKSLSWLLSLHQIKGYTKELYKNYLHEPDNHDGVITHVEPDIPECEIKWAFRSITMNKANGRIPAGLF